MHCFVATAFDRPDVDRIYDKAVRNVLKELSITPLRVDRHEHNDDIDDKIMELMRRADFCIADLTYARPSAYFEAGYMASTKSVIYIVRQDHFRQRDDDIEGNRAVHFDLKMKNIIGWKEPDAAFRKRLKARINKVLKPLIASKTKRELQSALQDNFRRLSLQSQTRNWSAPPKTYYGEMDSGLIR